MLINGLDEKNKQEAFKIHNSTQVMGFEILLSPKSTYALVSSRCEESVRLTLMEVTHAPTLFGYWWLCGDDNVTDHFRTLLLTSEEGGYLSFYPDNRSRFGTI
jgi:hypothetical protein